MGTLFKTEIQLIHNVVATSAIQQSDLALNFYAFFF